ncbi:uncharacterized protein SCHCODRAFT_02597239 [Schizophyllum commune H4-8]|uniref:Uncharacterized protein n=1 Tax=Schizophyllum commune (strain H4-8 / FGSC 9210) TaxID=578458 RepID=D8PYH3_SCHCM|nr:uncharacterized protein SCHCODRAFT_02597239 [Schizophyllum commune H4-8]KAI5895963.1 hypothetical protein SCHCODRAFT_02597239 [Schizophyllum commune H4-8]
MASSFLNSSSSARFGSPLQQHRSSTHTESQRQNKPTYQLGQARALLAQPALIEFCYPPLKRYPNLLCTLKPSNNVPMALARFLKKSGAFTKTGHPRAGPRTPRWEDEPDPAEDGGSTEDEGWEAAEEEVEEEEEEDAREE